ncbi:hypothetical protein A3850_018590 [Lewinella sp. 4G2]|nr:hypothetical protein A3850_018590 [Lewinella sp. 4G2]
MMMHCSMLYCQHNSISNIVWSATVEVNTGWESEGELNHRSKVVKYVSNTDDQAHMIGVNDFDLQHSIVSAIVRKELSVYRDEDLTSPLTDSEVDQIFIRTGLVDNNNRYLNSSGTDIVTTSLNRIKGSIGLVLDIELSEMGDLNQEVRAGHLTWEALNIRYNLYFKIHPLNDKIALTDEYTYVERKYFQMPFIAMKESFSSKQEKEQVLIQLSNAIASNINAFNNTLDWGEPYPSTIASLDGGVDTVEVIDENFNVTYVPFIREAFSKRVSGLRFYQFWAWDSNTNRLYVDPIGYAPLHSVSEQDGSFIYWQPEINWVRPKYRN